jgi:hypothetical protein
MIWTIVYNNDGTVRNTHPGDARSRFKLRTELIEAERLVDAQEIARGRPKLPAIKGEPEAAVFRPKRPYTKRLDRVPSGFLANCRLAASLGMDVVELTPTPPDALVKLESVQVKDFEVTGELVAHFPMTPELQAWVDSAPEGVVRGVDMAAHGSQSFVTRVEFQKLAGSIPSLPVTPPEGYIESSDGDKVEAAYWGSALPGKFTVLPPPSAPPSAPPCPPSAAAVPAAPIPIGRARKAAGNIPEIPIPVSREVPGDVLATLKRVREVWLDSPNVGRFSAWLNHEIARLSR